jgi:hypothetical protein
MGVFHEFDPPRYAKENHSTYAVTPTYNESIIVP